MNVRIEFFPRLITEARAIREEVFVIEQGFRHEFDEADERALHAVAYVGETAAGTLRIVRETADAVAIGRVAVRKTYRGQQIGQAMIEAAIEAARRSGAKTARISAQSRAVGFYEKCGFATTGDVVTDEGVPHVPMSRAL